jgi:mRNA interferase RelE/StbE
MANYKIVIEKRAKKELFKLPVNIRIKLERAIDLLSKNPRPIQSKSLIGADAYRLRVGNYRVIYEINDKIITIYIIKVAHRKDVYKK